MKAGELIMMLEDFNPNSEVRLAFQPEWPFEYRIADIQSVMLEGKELIYIAEAGQIGYLPGKISAKFGWSDDPDDDPEDIEDELLEKITQATSEQVEVASDGKRHITTKEEAIVLKEEFEEELSHDFDADRDFEGYCYLKTRTPRYTKEEAAEKNRLLQEALDFCEREGINFSTIDID